MVPGTAINPCVNGEYNDRSILQRLSCIARNHSIVLVANMPDKKRRLLFNTNLIFKTDGRLIAKYYKQHLFQYESLFFDTSNKNSMSHLICHLVPNFQCLYVTIFCIVTLH